MEYQLITPRIPQKNLTAVERVLTNRGIALAEIEHYLHTTDNDILNPKLIKNIHEGVKMLIKHIAQGDKIFIQVDSDCDGFTSASALMNYLNYLFPAYVQNNIIYRIHEEKQHGIIVDTIPKDIKLVIIPDAGSNQIEEHKQLFQKGIDVLVIDHHESDEISEYACIINNQTCDYPTKSLSGVGMVYKFCSYIDQLLNLNYSENILDLVALGLIADMVDLRDFETRHLVTLGLNKIRNPYFKGMIEKQAYSLKDEITPFGIAFYIAPYINATIRVGTQDEKLMLFESMLDYRGYELILSTKRGCKGQEETRVEQACRNCTNIKNRQTKARDASLDIVKQIIEENDLLENKILAIKLDNYEIDHNLTGLIANQLMSEYQRPILLLNKIINEDKTISWEGSGRGYDKSKFTHFKDFLNNTNLIEYAEGHQSAFGIGIKDEKFSDFIKYSNDLLKDYDFTPSYKVDYIFKNDDMNISEILELANLKSVWGQGVAEPLIAIEQIKIQANNLKLMSPDKNPTLKITLPNGMSLIKFRSSNEEYEKLCSELGCVTINIVGKCERNIWNGIVSPQVIIEDYEIVGKTEYYF